MLILRCSEGARVVGRECSAREQSCLDLPLSRQQMIRQLAWRKEVWLLGSGVASPREQGPLGALISEQGQLGLRPQPTWYPQQGGFCLPFTRERTGLGSCTQYPSLLDMSRVMAESTRHTTRAGLRPPAVTVTCLLLFLLFL